jgi:D-alanine-D-alanine ligase
MSTVEKKKRVAVLFGGRSPEHDVSVITGLQALAAIDRSQFVPFPVYITLRGEWYLGNSLAERKFYIPNSESLRKCTRVRLDLTPNSWGTGSLIHEESGWMRKTQTTEFDVAFLALHGLNGENGTLQGAFELAHVPYTGSRALTSSLWMDKATTKSLLARSDIPMLPHRTIPRPRGTRLLDVEAIQSAIAGMSFPLIAKPNHLGSSIGVARVNTLDELRSVLSMIFKLDSLAIVEPFVENLVEYNIAVKRFDGPLRTSAIERPKRTAELLDFKQKYMSGGKTKGSGASPPSSEGMLSLTREISPKLPGDMESKIRAWAATCFELCRGSGAPRIDFLSNESTGEVWLNEVNPCPGSFGYFLWEAAEEPILFTDLLTGLIEEAELLQKETALPDDPVPKDAQLLPRGN